jgi:hypothetical protein
MNKQEESSKINYKNGKKIHHLSLSLFLSAVVLSFRIIIIINCKLFIIILSINTR